MKTHVALVLLALAPFAATTSAQTFVERLHGPPYPSFDGFGSAVATSEGRTIVGAPYVDGLTSYEGAAYVFEARGSGVRRVVELLSPEPGASAYFGITVAIDGDVALVGANDDGSGAFAGVVYVFLRESGVWTYSEKLEASDAGPAQYFGNALTLDGDVAMIGALFNAKGAVYAFRRTANGFREEQVLRANRSKSGFGASLALDGGRLLVGADARDVNRLGSAYVFEETAQGWVERQELLPAGLLASDSYGAFVALEGDVAVISAYFDDDTGLAYPFHFDAALGAAGEWVLEAPLAPVGGVAFWSYGIGLAIEDDRLLVGNPVSGPGWFNGEDFVDVYRRNGGAWQLEDKLRPPTGEPFGGAFDLEDALLVIGQPSAFQRGNARMIDLDRELHLFGDETELSLATGGEQILAIESDASHAGLYYYVLGSVSGAGSTPIGGGVVLPLVWDAYTNTTAYRPTLVLSNSLGVLDANGEAVARFVLPPTTLALAGLRLYHAAVLLDASVQPLAASNAVSVTLGR